MRPVHGRHGWRCSHGNFVGLRDVWVQGDRCHLGDRLLPDNSLSNHGSSLDPTIASTTLTAGDVCFASISYQSGTAGINWELNVPAGQPFITYLGGNGPSTRPDSANIGGNYYVADSEKAGWAAGTATTAQFTSSGASAVGWDELVVCLPTNPLSGGAPRGSGDASASSQAFSVFNPTVGGVVCPRGHKGYPRDQRPR